MTPASRARDFVLIGGGAVCLVVAAVFIAGRIWFRGLFVAAMQHDPLPFGLGFLAVGAVLGILHTFLPRRLAPEQQGAYKDSKAVGP